MTKKQVFAFLMITAGTAAAGYLLYRTFRDHSAAEIVASLGAIPMGHMAMALLYALGSYFCLTGFDWVGVRSIDGKLTYPRIALASFIALSIGQSVGLSGLSSGALRYRYYAHWGLDTENVAKIVLLSGVTVGMGMAVLSGAVMIINPADAAVVLRLSEGTIIVLGAGCLTVAAAYLLMAAWLRTPVNIRTWSFQMPPIRLAATQVAIGTMNYIFVSACLREVMTADANVSFLKAATAFMLANFAILMTHAPGGLGVLEATVQHVMGNQASVGSLVAFRIIYFFIPLLIGLPLALVVEAIFRVRKRISKASTASKAPVPAR
nr:YbhN family protein [uncultured Shinella sp.]